MNEPLFKLTIDDKTCIIERSSNLFVVNFFKDNSWAHSTKCINIDEARDLAMNYLGVAKNGPTLLNENQ